MIHHFPNFVCWKEVYENFQCDRDVISLDGISCRVVGALLGVSGNYFSGPEMAHRLKKQCDNNLFFLLPKNIKSIADHKKFILPFADTFDNDELLNDFIKKIPINSIVIIGISSPKQNYLARYLHSVRRDLKFFCLGAAVLPTWGSDYGNTVLRGTGFQWLEFLIIEPKRTFKKQVATWRAIFKVLRNHEERSIFKEFVAATKKPKNTDCGA